MFHALSFEYRNGEMIFGKIISRYFNYYVLSANVDPGPAKGLKVFFDDLQKGHSQSSGRSLKAVPGGVFVFGSPLSGS